MRFLTALAFAIVAALLASIGYVFSGRYDVAASSPQSVLAAWVLDETMEQSVREHAASIPVPPLQDRQQVHTGYEHYAAMCEMCHGAPGVEPSELARGLEPAPPLLHEDEESTEWNAADLFWITKHGIKMTGMPAWGATHSDEEIWAIVAFVQKLPELSAEEYAALRNMPLAPTAHHHEHGETHGSEGADTHADSPEHGEAHEHAH
jgi:mono/diheme cytochrome c family protein